jgi:hypothetical protein
MKRLFLILAMTALLAACVGPPKGQRPPPMRRMSGAVSKETRQCLANLSAAKSRYTLLPDQDLGNGCAYSGAVQLSDTGIPITNIRALGCPMSLALSRWTRDVLQPAAREHLGSRVVRLDSMGGYACRRQIGNSSDKLSEHAKANAVDIGGFVLADGRRITVKGGWNGSDDERDFLRAIRKGACERFQVVLSPDYNAAHHDHLHFDLGRGPFCR